MQKGIIQGYPLSTFLFNVLVDCEVKNLVITFPEIDRNMDIHTETMMAFYDDDRMIAGTDKIKIELQLDKLNDILNNLGLVLNFYKSECMASFPPIKIRIWTDEVYVKCFDKKLGLTKFKI